MYKIIYSDNTEFMGGDYFNSRWNEITKEIKSVDYQFPKKRIFVKNYDEYNHQIEKVSFPFLGQEKIIAIILMVRYDSKLTILRYNLLTNILTVKHTLFTDKYKAPFITGWKKGYREGIPTII